jgi:hypothetical protein
MTGNLIQSGRTEMGNNSFAIRLVAITVYHFPRKLMANNML